MNKKSRNIKLIVNMVCCAIMSFFPTGMSIAIVKRGYHESMYPYVFTTRVVVYTLVLIIIMISVGNYFDTSEKDK